MCQWGDSPMGHKRWLRKEMGREPDLVEAQCLLSFTHYKWESSSAAPNLFMIDCSLELFTTKEVWTFGENPSSRHPYTHPHFNTKGSFQPQEMKFEMTSGHTSTAAPLFLPMYTLALSLWKGTVLYGEAILIRVNYRRLTPLCGKVSILSHGCNRDGNRNWILGDRMFEGDLGRVCVWVPVMLCRIGRIIICLFDWLGCTFSVVLYFLCVSKT